MVLAWMRTHATTSLPKHVDREVRPLAAATVALLLALGTLASTLPASAAAVFRPRVADPREAESRWRMVSYTADWRYGTDLTDSTSHGGFENDRQGLEWEAAGGHTFRWRPLRRQHRPRCKLWARVRRRANWRPSRASRSGVCVAPAAVDA